MIVINYVSKLFLLFVLSMAGMVYCNAQGGKSLSVKKVMCTASPEGEAVPSLLDENEVEFHSIDVVNWKDYPYKPEVSFRIAHTGHEILLHYKVKEASVRAVAAGDNGRVWEDACVEFFVSPDGDDCYYNFECNCIGRLLVQGGAVNERRPTASPEVLELIGHRAFRRTLGRVQLGTGDGHSRFRILQALCRFPGWKNNEGELLQVRRQASDSPFSFLEPYRFGTPHVPLSGIFWHLVF